MSDNAAPERIWLLDLYSAPWPGAYRNFHASDLLHEDCPEYLRLDLHTAALAARDARIAALEARLRPFAVAFQAALTEVPDRPISLAAFGALAKLHVDAAHFQAARALLDGGKP